MKILSLICILCSLSIMTGCTGNQSGNTGTKTQAITTPITIQPQLTANTSTSAASGTQQKEFTLEELKKYNGQNGSAAYIAVNGIVYDVTNSDRWTNGLHNDCSSSTYAGADFSDLINSSPHGASVMRKVPVVGTLKK